MIQKVVKVFRKRGFFGGLKYAVRKFTGRAALEESIDSLYYYLNRCCDIRSFPKAEGNLRELQLCDAELLRLFDAVCKKNGLVYWLDFGTLLGAERHKGFIPWDDDLDVAMPRTDFEKAFRILPDGMKEYDIEVTPFPLCPMGVFGFSYRHKETGIWLDVFPVDEYHTDDELGAIRETLTNDVIKYRKYYEKHKLKMGKKEFYEAKERFYLARHAKPSDGSRTILINDPEFDPVAMLHDAKDVYPLSTILFEGYELVAPKDVGKYLATMYGPDYMCFPRAGIEHHGSEDAKLKDRAERHGLDLKVIREELKTITDRYVNA